MKLPRDLSADDLIALLSRFGYKATRQKGSHIRLSTGLNGEHHLTIPRHTTLRTGTLNAVITDVATHFTLSKQDVLSKLFGEPR